MGNNDTWTASAVSPDGRVLALGNLYGEIQTVAWGKAGEVGRWTTQRQPISSLWFDSTASSIVSFDAGGVVAVWNASTGQRRSSFTVEGAALVAASDTVFAALGRNNRLSIKRLPDGQELFTTRPSEPVVGLALSGDGQRIAILTSAGKIVLFAIAPWRKIAVWRFDDTAALALDRKGSIVLAAGPRAGVAVFSPGTTGPLRSWSGAGRTPSVSNDGTKLAFILDNAGKLVSWPTDEELLALPLERLIRAQLSGAGAFLVLQTEDKFVAWPTDPCLLGKRPPVAADGAGKNLALLVGVAEYQDLPSVPQAPEDLSRITSLMPRAGVPGSRLALLSGAEATMAALEAQVSRWIPNHATSEGTILFFFSGRGAVDPVSGERYLLLRDSNPAYLAETAYPLDRLSAQLSSAGSSAVVMFLDTCFGEGRRCGAKMGVRPLVPRRALPADGRLGVLSATDFTATVVRGATGGSVQSERRINLPALVRFLDKTLPEPPETSIGKSFPLHRGIFGIDECGLAPTTATDP